MFSRSQDGGAYFGADVGGKCMVSLGKLVLYTFVASWYGWFWSTAKFGDNWKKALLPPSSTSEGQKGTGDDDDDLL